jgi:hypothetical protein
MADQHQLEDTLQVVTIKAGLNNDRSVRGMFDSKKKLHLVGFNSRQDCDKLKTNKGRK